MKHFIPFVLASMIVSASLCLAEQTELTTKPTNETKPVAIIESYPDLASSGLAYATLAELPEGTVLRSGSLEITQMKLDAEISKVPVNIRDQLKKNSFFLLEQMATQELLLAEAKAELTKAKKNLAGKTNQQILSEYLKGLTVKVKVKVTEGEVAAFYEENKAMFGGASLEQSRPQIKQYLLQQKKQEAVNRHIVTFGKRTKIEVDASWIERQAVLAKDNPVDKARNSGTASLVDFGADGCRPCDMMTPILKTLSTKYQGKLNVEFVHVRQEQILAARYGVQSIPVQIFFDKEGKEFFRHTGFFPQLEIEKKLAEMGVK